MHSIALDQLAVVAVVTLLMSLLLITALLIPWDDEVVPVPVHDLRFALVEHPVGFPRP